MLKSPHKSLLAETGAGAGVVTGAGESKSKRISEYKVREETETGKHKLIFTQKPTHDFTATLLVIAKNAVNPNVLLWVKHTVVHPYDGLLFSNKQTGDIYQNNLMNLKGIMLSKGYILHDSINIPEVTKLRDGGQISDCRGLGTREGVKREKDVVKNGGHKGSLSCGTVWCPEPGGGSRNTSDETAQN